MQNKDPLLAINTKSKVFDLRNVDFDDLEISLPFRNIYVIQNPADGFVAKLCVCVIKLYENFFLLR